MRPELVDATLRRREESRRQEEEKRGWSENQAVTGMMALQQVYVRDNEARAGGHQLVKHEAGGGQQLVSNQVLQAVQELQQPLPRHLLLAKQQQQQLQDHSSAADDDTKPRKKVLLQLRQNNASSSRPSSSSSGRTVHQTVTSSSSTNSLLSLAAQLQQQQHQQQQRSAVKSQTYFIFHPMTQTFEPITINDFQENEDIVEEIVVEGDATVGVVGAATNDYVEVVETSGDNSNAKIEEVQQDSPMSVLSDYQEDVKKPIVISPLIKQQSRKRKAETEMSPRSSDVRIMNKSAPTSVIKKMSPSTKQNTTVNTKNEVNAKRINLLNVIEETIMGNKNSKGLDHDAFDEEGNVNIEDLVDVCFEEELGREVTEDEEEKYEVPLKRKCPGDETLAPLKKRHQCKTSVNDDLVQTDDDDVVWINSHRILEFSFTTQEKLFLFSLVDSSNHRDKVGTLLTVARPTSLTRVALDFVVKDRAAALILSILHELKEESGDKTVEEKYQLLLYRYLSSQARVTDASSLAHNMIGLIENKEI